MFVIPTSYRVTFACAGLFFAIALVRLALLESLRAEDVGVLIFIILAPAAAVGWLMGRSDRQAPRWKIVLLYSTAVLLVVAAQSYSGYTQSLKMPAMSEVQKVTHAAVETAEVDRQLVKIAEKFNANSPQMVDSEIRLDKKLAEPGRVLNYFFTVMSFKANEVDAQQMKKELGVQHLEDFCNMPEMGVFRDSRVKFVMVYSGSDGVEITRIPISQSDCKGTEVK